MAYLPGEKIGEYIHWRYENYMRYGLARKLSIQSSPQGSLSKYLQEAKQEAIGHLRRVSNHEGKLKDLENKMQYIMGKRTGQGEIVDAKVIQEIQAGMLKSLQVKVNDLSAEDINWETLSLKPSGVDKVKNSKINIEEALKSIDPERRLKLQTLLRNLKKDRHNIASFKTRIEHVKAVVQSIGLGQTKESDLLKEISKIEAALGNKISGRFYDQSLVDDLISIAKQVITFASISKFEGDMAEHFAAHVGKAIASVGQKAINEVVGSLKEQNVIKTTDFMKGLDPSSILGKSYRKSEDGLYFETINQPDGKVDVNLTIDDTIIGASIKNYNLSSKNPKLQSISLVSGTSLLYLFANKAKFLNHYLNQTVDTAPSSIIQSANEQMKLMILLSAFVGGGARKGQNGIYNNRADLFIINDKSKKYGIRVFSISELFETIIQAPNLMGGVEVNLKNSQRWNNKFYTEDGSGIQILNSAMATKRIQNILTQVHSLKLKASIGFDTMRGAIDALSKK